MGLHWLWGVGGCGVLVVVGCWWLWDWLWGISGCWGVGCQLVVGYEWMWDVGVSGAWVVVGRRWLWGADGCGVLVVVGH